MTDKKGTKRQGPHYCSRKLQHLITAEYLRTIRHYDPDTGIFTRLVSPQGMKPVGSQVAKIAQGRYVWIKIKGLNCLGHRLAWLYMTGEWPPIGIDHINNEVSDNRWANLRLATPKQNAANMPAHKDSRSGLKGAAYQPYGRWRASIRIDGKTRELGCHATALEAHRAYCAAAKEAHGVFAFREVDNGE